MLGQRIVTAVLLLALLVPALLAPSPWPFQALALLLIGAAGWEWGRLNGASPAGAWLLGVLTVALCLGSWTAGWVTKAPAILWWLVGACWVLGGAWALRAGVVSWARCAKPLRWAIGLAVLWAAWLAISQARGAGHAFILSVFVLVWVADVAAYFGGRALGGPKLAPTISPGKTWSGAVCGVAGVLLLVAGLWAWLPVAVFDATVYAELARRWGLWGGLVLLMGLIAMSVVGDLFESLVKRAAGAKDSSRLLPGHGGVLDRVDALLPVFPLSLCLASGSP